VSPIRLIYLDLVPNLFLLKDPRDKRYMICDAEMQSVFGKYDRKLI